MQTTIVLEEGTQRVKFRDIPALLADAIHPSLPDDTPRILSYLQKEAISLSLAKRWCGEGNNFPVALDPGDWKLLHERVWAGLPALDIELDNDGNATKVLSVLTEAEWHPYQAALEANPRRDWNLVPVWRDTALERWILNHEAQKDWRRFLEQQVARGDISPKSEVTHLPVSGLVGRQLDNSFFTVEEFIDFVRQFSVQVRIRRYFEREPIVARLLAKLRELPPEEYVVVLERVTRDRRSTGSATVADHISVLEPIDAQQKKGIFTVPDAAWLLAKEYPKQDVTDLIARMMAAKIKDGSRRLVRNPSGFPVLDDEHPREWMCTVMASEVDAWLESNGMEIRLMPLLDELTEESPRSAEAIPPLDHAPPPPEAHEPPGSRPAEGPSPMIKEDIALLFDGVKWTTELWRKELASPPKWLIPARVAPGERGGAPSTWNPVGLASILIARGDATEDEVSDAFRAKRFLESVQVWLPNWKEHLALRRWGQPDD